MATKKMVTMTIDGKILDKADKILKKAKLTRSGFCESMMEIIKQDKEGSLSEELRPWAEKFMKYAQDKIKEKEKKG